MKRMCSVPVLSGVLFLGIACGGAAASEGGRGHVVPGIDVLRERGFEPLRGRRVGLITNHTGLTRDAESTIDVLHVAPEVNLVALFSPEHGIRGTADEKVASSVDDRTGLPIHSLYGATRRPTPEMLEDIDTLVFDIQDIGTRFYTYIGTMALAMQAAKEHGKTFVVLDRPNPIAGEKVEGFVADASVVGGLTAIYPIPTRHGMTVGELAGLFNEEFGIGCDLTVIPMRNWRRWMYWDDTGLLWVNPSPNMKTLNGAILYPGPGAAETTWISCGRGTDRPFEMYGAPYMDGTKLAAELNRRGLPGVRFVPYDFTPSAKYHKFEGQPCRGVFIIVFDRDKVESVRTGLHMIQAMKRLFPDDYKALGGFPTSYGKPDLWNLLIEKGMSPETIIEEHRPELESFLDLRKKHLLYD